MPAHPAQACQTLQGADRPNGANRSGWIPWCSWHARYPWSTGLTGRDGITWPSWSDRPIWTTRTYGEGRGGGANWRNRTDWLYGTNRHEYDGSRLDARDNKLYPTS